MNLVLTNLKRMETSELDKIQAQTNSWKQKAISSPDNLIQS